VFKGLSDARGDSLQSVKPHVMNDYLIKRSSMSKIEVQNILSKKGGEKSGSLFPLQNVSNNPTSVRIIHMSNTHNHLTKNSKRKFYPDGDILIHSGGFTVDGTVEEYEQFNEWLLSVKDVYHYRIVIAGLNDVKQCGNDWDFVKQHLSNATHVLCHSECAVLGMRIYGCPWHWAHEHNYAIKAGAPSSTSGRFDDIPAGIDVLITHGPAYGRLDLENKFISGKEYAQKEVDNKNDNIHLGSRELSEAIRQVRPGLHLHGLCTEARGFVSPHGHTPLTLNSCMCDSTMKIMYTSPHVIKCNLLYTASTDKVNAGHMYEFAMDSLM